MKIPAVLLHSRWTWHLLTIFSLALASQASADTRYVEFSEKLVVSSDEFRDWDLVVRLGGTLVLNEGAVLGGDAPGSGRIYVQDASSLIINGGVIGGNGTLSGRIEAKDNAIVIIRGGTFGAGRQTGTPILDGNATATVTGGNFGGHDFASGQFELYANSKLIIEGGVFGSTGEESGRILTSDNAQVEIRGGTYGGTGGRAGTLRPSGSSLWAILGCEFNQLLGVNTFPEQQYVTLTGTFHTGETLSTLIYRELGASVELRRLAVCGDQPAVRLDVAVGNPIRVDDLESSALIQTIYNECDGLNYDFTTHPFSAPANQEAVIHSSISPCPPGASYSPTVHVNWTIEGSTLRGANQWIGPEGDIHVTVPDHIGFYTVNFEFSINDGPAKVVSRRLLVTKRTPLLTDPPGRLSAYERAIEWTAGISASSPDFDTLSVLLSSMFAYGQTHWHYGGQKTRLTGQSAPGCNDPRFGYPLPLWEKMLVDPMNPGFCPESTLGGKCYLFSELLANTAAILGVAGLVDHPVYPSGNFVTVKAPSIDPGFPGNALDKATGIYDRYFFGSHSLLQYGAHYFDATFGRIYSNDQQFVAYVEDGGTGVDEDGKLYHTTPEGARIYESYPMKTEDLDSWGAWYFGEWLPQYPFLWTWGGAGYSEPGTAILGPAEAMALSANVAPPVFTGEATYTAVDDNGDGLADRLLVNVDVDAPQAGTLVLSGRLEHQGNLVAAEPFFHSVAVPTVWLEAVHGINTFTLEFSGEQILRSGVDGPYDLKLQVVGVGPGNHATATLHSAALNHGVFGELGAQLNAASESAQDIDGNGLLDRIRVVVEVGVRRADSYKLQVNLSKDGVTLAGASTAQAFAIGSTQVPLIIPAAILRRGGLDGPYKIAVDLEDATGTTLGAFEFESAAYQANHFAALAQPSSASTDQGIDSNNNGLFDVLRVSQALTISQAGDYLLSAKLSTPGGSKSVSADTRQTLIKGANTVIWDFAGPLIWVQQLDGPYQVEVVVRDAATGAERDRLTLPQLTQAYDHRLFDNAAPVGEIHLSGVTSDSGVDTNGNGLFDQLMVNLQILAPRTANYEWSARLEDQNGTEIGFYEGQGSIAEGMATLSFVFGGKTINYNGVNGPYRLSGLVIFAPGLSALLATEAAVTQAYLSSQFEPPVHGNVRLDSALSLATHGAQGQVGIPLNLTGQPTSDPRRDVNNIVVRFTAPVGPATGSLTPDKVVVSSSPSGAIPPYTLAFQGGSNTGDELTIQFSQPLPDQRRYALDFQNFADSVGDFLGGQTSLEVRVLQGDANNNGSVTATDVSFVRGRINQVAAPGQSARSDVNISGTVTGPDISFVRARIGHSAP